MASSGLHSNGYTLARRILEPLGDDDLVQRLDVGVHGVGQVGLQAARNVERQTACGVHLLASEGAFIYHHRNARR
mgnify:CR=1 FL=1